MVPPPVSSSASPSDPAPAGAARSDPSAGNAAGAEPEESREPGAESAERLERFCAATLDWAEVRALFEACAFSSLGRRALRQLAPRDDEGARAALERLREFCSWTRGGPPLGGVSDPLPALVRARRYGRALDEPELHQLARFLDAGASLAAWLREREVDLPANAALGAGLPDLSDLRRTLDAALDPRGELRDDASPLLARVRREIESLAAKVDRLARDAAGRSELRAALADGHAGRVHRRAGRPCLAVRAKARGRVPGIVHDRSQTGETLFVEPEAVVEAGNRLATARLEESREGARILGDLTRAVLLRAGDVERAAGRLADLELAAIGAAYAREHGGRPARTPGDPGAAAGLSLRAARHPLLVAQQRAGRLERAVPIDLRLGDDFDLLVITGPNTGGKTLALKTAGLAALLTRMGLPLPCDEGTTVPLYDGVAADIGDEQEVRQNLSTFSSHLVRIRRGLEGATERTLFLLDELGGGTDPAEGAALGDALLETLLGRRVPTLATTHIGKLKEFAFRNARAENASAEFDLDTLRPLYTLVTGAPGESRALAVARRVGLCEELLRRAEARLERPADEAHQLMQELRGSREEAERLRGRVEERLLDVERELEEQTGRTGELERKRHLLEDEAQRGLEERVRRARPWLDRARAVTGQLPAAAREALTEALDGLATALEGVALSESRERFLEGLAKGRLVWLPRYRKRCSVVRVDRKRRQVTVRLGNQRVTVSFDDVGTYEGA